MKKSLFIIIMLISTMFVSIGVNGDITEEDEHKLIYDIEKFNVTKDTITFEGWAFIDRLHNEGEKNTIISISAITENNELKGDIEYNSKKDESLYESKCNRESGVGKPCYETHDNATCNFTNYKSSCRFDNVGFKVIFSIKELLKYLGEDKDITFKLKVTTNGITKESDIAVSSDPNVSNVKSGDKIAGDNTTIIISDISSKALITADNARVLSDIGEFLCSSSFKWQRGSLYSISDVVDKGKYPGIRMYGLEYKDKYCTTDTTGKAEPGKSSIGYAYATWIQVEGSVKITLGDGTCPSEKNNVPGTLNCDNEEEQFVQTIRMDNVQLIDTITESMTDYASRVGISKSSKGGCSTELTRTITANNVCITQKGFAKFNLDTNIIYSGGGFNFNAAYSGVAYYEFCGDSEKDNLSYKITEQEAYYYCPNAKNQCQLNSHQGVTCYYRISDEIRNSYSDEIESIESEISALGEQISKLNPETQAADIEDLNKKIAELQNNIDDIQSNLESIESDCNYTKEELEGCDTITTTNKQVEKNSSEWVIFTEYMQDLLEEPQAEAKTESYNSNEVDYVFEEIGTWETTYVDDNNENSQQWEPNEYVSYNINFSLDNACINRRTAEVRYTTGSCNENELYGERLYYIPIKYAKNTTTEEFPIKAHINDVNVLKDEVWEINYLCDVDCQRKLPDIDSGFKFIYRPINLSNPFPNNRIPGDNWKSLVANQNEYNKVMSRDTLEYNITLNPKTISDIKRYNKNKNYANLNTISNDGRSTFLKNELNITNLIKPNNFNKLGECTNNCWGINSSYTGDGGY